MIITRIYDYTFGYVYVSSPLYEFIDLPMFDEYNLGQVYHDNSGYWGTWEGWGNPKRDFELCMA